MERLTLTKQFHWVFWENLIISFSKQLPLLGCQPGIYPSKFPSSSLIARWKLQKRNCYKDVEIKNRIVQYVSFDSQQTFQFYKLGGFKDLLYIVYHKSFFFKSSYGAAPLHFVICCFCCQFLPAMTQLSELSFTTCLLSCMEEFLCPSLYNFSSLTGFKQVKLSAFLLFQQRLFITIPSHM